MTVVRFDGTCGRYNGERGDGHDVIKYVLISSRGLSRILLPRGYTLLIVHGVFSKRALNV
jgi:hypothetical protein